MALPTYSRTDRVGDLYEKLFYARPGASGRSAGPDRDARPADRAEGHEGGFDPDVENPNAPGAGPDPAARGDDAQHRPQLALRGDVHGRAAAAGNDDQSAREDVDKNTILKRTKWDDLPAACRDFPLGGAVASSACFPGGFPPMVVPGLFDDLTVELVDGGVHDNQGVEGLVDRGCSHWIISDGSGQMPDLKKPSTRLPAVLGRVISIYGDAEREQRLLQLLREGDSVAFMHLQTGLPARERTPGGQVSEKETKIESTDFGVVEDVQRALAQVRTDLDAFCEVEAWSLMADAYQLTGRIVPTRAGLISLGTPGSDVEWSFQVVAEQLAQPSEKFLKVLRVSKQRFLKPSRMLPAVLPIVLVLLLAAVGAAAYGLWLLLTPHGTALFIAILAALGALAIYANSEKAFVKPVAIVIFDVVLPALLALPLVVISWLQLGAGRWWLSLGRAKRL